MTLVELMMSLHSHAVSSLIADVADNVQKINYSLCDFNLLESYINILNKYF